METVCEVMAILQPERYSTHTQEGVRGGVEGLLLLQGSGGEAQCVYV